MALMWTKEDAPRWDADKRRLFDATALASVGMSRHVDDSALPDEWWRATDDTGTVLGYGWLDAEWGDAQITFFVDAARRGAGIGSFILDRLDREAAARGLNYVYNVVPATHPDPDRMRDWLTARGFRPGTGDLRRRVHVGASTR
jgi:GNAT superfamily N-acetyltransferase